VINLIKYIRPSWYFNLVPSLNEVPYWLDIDKVPTPWKEHVSIDSGYVSDSGRRFDSAYQMWAQGIITNEKEYALNKSNDIPLSDQYRFIKRFYNPVWSYVVCMFRIMELNNPFKEIKALWQSRQVSKISTSNNPFKYNLDAFSSDLLKQAPLVSVIIPTLNRYKYLKDVLRDLDKQDYPNIEIIIVDQSEPFREDFYQGVTRPLTVWHQSEKALWLARNSAIQRAKGDYILLYDDDSLVESDWVSQHIKCIDYFKSAISSGVSIALVGAEVPSHYSYFRWSDQIDTGNVMLHRHVFESIGLFDRQFEKQRMGDGEFGLRAYLHGFKNISNPLAKRVHLKVEDGGLRQMGSWDAWRPKNFFAPRPIPSVLYLIRSYFGNAAAIRNIILAIMPSIVPYRFKNNKVLLVLGTIFGVITLPLLSISVIRSWRLSSKKIKQGKLVEKLFPNGN
jgi:glycosyltransferase involved in cell wall biosynthesis